MSGTCDMSNATAQRKLTAPIGACVLAIVAGIAMLSVAVPRINGVRPENVPNPVLTENNHPYLLRVIVTPERVADNVATVTWSVDGLMPSVFTFGGGDRFVCSNGRPSCWERHLLAKSTSYIHLAVSHIAFGYIACEIIDVASGQRVPGGFNSRPDPGSVRCNHNRPIR